MATMQERHFDILRRHMVERIAITVEMAAEEIGKDELNDRVMEVMGRVPRHLFVPPELAAVAYENTPLPIGFSKTISQPFIVALMTDLLDPQPDDVILEIGTGLGYQAAVLASMVRKVWSVEAVEELAAEAETRFDRLGIDNVTVRVGDGSKGWAEHAPFDRIMVTAAPEMVPPVLITQLKPGGRMVLPAGPADQQKLTVVDKNRSGHCRTRETISVRFSALETVM
jgi:protein-L-isoaspartate(D-aspartate) O-methyltransferase